MREINAAIALLRAVARPEQVRLLAAVGEAGVTITVLSERTGIPVKTLAKELVRLESAGLVSIDKGTIAQTPVRVANLADALERELPISAIAARHGVERFFKHGLLVSTPVEPVVQGKLAAMLVELIPNGETFTEAEINEMLGAVHPDHALLRRLLVDWGLLERGAGVDYRRVASRP